MTGSTPFLVVGRHNRRILHEAATLAEARGFSEGCSRPTAIAILPELRLRGVALLPSNHRG